MRSWDERYEGDEFVYGKDANDFLIQELDKLRPGRVLFPAEGEGRNAVYAASHDWEVHAFDLSMVGQKKALAFASEMGVEIDYTISDVLAYNSFDKFDCIAISFMHLPSKIRRLAHRNLMSQLKPGGCLIMEVFHKEQMPLKSGGPKDLDLLYDEELLAEDFKDVDVKLLEKTKRVLNEGKLHQGEAIVLRLIAKK